MRAFAVVLIIAGFACGESECFTDPMDVLLDPQTGTCVAVSNADGCAYCVASDQRCIVADAVELD